MPDEHALFHRLDVDVARLALDRAFDDQIDEVDDRRGFAGVLQPGDRFEDVFLAAPCQRCIADMRLARAVAPRRAAAGQRQLRSGLVRYPRERLVGVADLDRLENVGARRNDLLDTVARLEFEILHKAEQQRIGHRHRQEIFLEDDGDAHALDRDFLGDQDDGGRIGRVFREIYVRESQLQRERLRDLFFSREVHPDEHDTKPYAGALVLNQGVLEIAVADEACLDEALAYFLAQSGPRPKYRNELEESIAYD